MSVTRAFNGLSAITGTDDHRSMTYVKPILFSHQTCSGIKIMDFKSFWISINQKARTYQIRKLSLILKYISSNGIIDDPQIIYQIIK
jgi:hypothetical protein